jgi:hypothetical protein
LSTWTNGSSNSSLVNKSVCRFRGKFEAVEKVQKKVERIPDLEIDKVNVLFVLYRNVQKIKLFNYFV